MNEQLPVVATERLPEPAQRFDVNVVRQGLQARKSFLDEVRKWMGSLLIPGVHYGTVPGVSKPFLFKPGADTVLSATGSHIEIVKEINTPIEGHDGHFDVSYVVRIVSSQGLTLGEGVGSCSTMETKYAFVKGRERSNIADMYNTVRKMSKKRAFVDAAITAFGLSDIFTQPERDDDEAGDDFGSRPAKPLRAPQREPEGDDVGRMMARVIEDRRKDTPPPRTPAEELEHVRKAVQNRADTLAEDLKWTKDERNAELKRLCQAALKKDKPETLEDWRAFDDALIERLKQAPPLEGVPF